MLPILISSIPLQLLIKKGCNYPIGKINYDSIHMHLVSIMMLTSILTSTNYTKISKNYIVIGVLD